MLRSGQADIVENVYGEKSAFHAILDNPLIYKLHVRGFTKLAPGLVETEGGTFAALAQRSAYIQKLGMNIVLLMPCYEFHEVLPTHSPPASGHTPQHP